MTITQALPRTTLSPAALLDLLGTYVTSRAGRLPLAQPGLVDRSYELLELSDDMEIWAIHWPKDQGLQLHDHGGSTGALWVLEGDLEECFVDAEYSLSRRRLVAGSGAAFGATYVHDVVNSATAPATSIHAYSPPMPSMTFYRLDGAGLVADRAEYRADPAWAP
jgi:Cysteine dioxygenase type I